MTAYFQTPPHPNSRARLLRVVITYERVDLLEAFMPWRTEKERLMALRLLMRARRPELFRPLCNVAPPSRAEWAKLATDRFHLLYCGETNTMHVLAREDVT
jgi:hypothetical protein